MAKYSGEINIPARHLSSKYYEESCNIYLEKGKIISYEIGFEISRQEERVWDETNQRWETEYLPEPIWEMDGFAESFNKETFTSDSGNECRFELLDIFQKQLKTSCIYILADSLAKKGYKHQAVLWALFNEKEVPANWELEYIGKPETEELSRYESLKNKAKLLALSKYAVSVGIPVLHITTFENWAGEQGYDEYDLVLMVKSGYVVTCWSSHAFGGNCNCYSHDPGYDYSHPINVYEIPEIYKKLEEVLSAKYADASITLEV